jgi:hypothetical protein
VQRNGSGRRAPNRRPIRSGGPCAGVSTATTPRSRCRGRSTCSARGAFWKNCAGASARTSARSSSSNISSGCCGISRNQIRSQKTEDKDGKGLPSSVAAKCPRHGGAQSASFTARRIALIRDGGTLRTVAEARAYIAPSRIIWPAIDMIRGRLGAPSLRRSSAIWRCTGSRLMSIQFASGLERPLSCYLQL